MGTFIYINISIILKLNILILKLYRSITIYNFFNSIWSTNLIKNIFEISRVLLKCNIVATNIQYNGLKKYKILIINKELITRNNHINIYNHIFNFCKVN